MGIIQLVTTHKDKQTQRDRQVGILHRSSLPSSLFGVTDESALEDASTSISTLNPPPLTTPPLSLSVCRGLSRCLLPSPHFSVLLLLTPVPALPLPHSSSASSQPSPPPLPLSPFLQSAARMEPPCASLLRPYLSFCNFFQSFDHLQFLFLFHVLKPADGEPHDFARRPLQLASLLRQHHDLLAEKRNADRYRRGKR